MSHDKIQTAIVTVTYHCESFIEAFLQSLIPELAPDFSNHLFIVDNLSGDNTLATIDKFVTDNDLHNKVTVLPLDQNKGFGAGCNAGVAAAKPYNPEYYWFVNPDTQIFEETAPSLLKFLEDHPKAGFVCSQLLDDDNAPSTSSFRFPSIYSELCGALRLGIVDKMLAHKNIAMPISEVAHQAEWITGASFIARSSAFDALNGFDETFFLYFEEVDLCFRAKQLGFECWINPKSRIYHIAGASTGLASGRKMVKRRPQYWFNSRRYFYCKNYGRLYFAFVDLTVVIALSIFKLRAAIQRKESNDPPHLLQDYARNSLFLSPKGKR